MPLSINEAYCYCFRCGAKNESRENTQLSKCSQCGYTQHFNPITAVGVVLVNSSNQVVLVRRNREPGKGKLGVAGGFVDLGETAEVAAIREVQEEIGIAIAELKYLGTFPNHYQYQNVVVPVLDIFFCARIDDNHVFELAADEVSEIGAFPLDESTFEQMAFESNRSALKLWKSLSERA